MAPGGLVSTNGDWSPVWVPGWGRGLFTVAVHAPPRAPAPVPGTCHQAFCGDSVGIHQSWWAGPRPEPEGIMGRPAARLLPGATSLCSSGGRRTFWVGAGQFLAPGAM